jgi:hypothetical protein
MDTHSKVEPAQETNTVNLTWTVTGAWPIKTIEKAGNTGNNTRGKGGPPPAAQDRQVRDGEVVWDTAMGTKSAITIQVLRRRITPVSEWEGGVREGMVPHRESMGTWRWAQRERGVGGGGAGGARRKQSRASQPVHPGKNRTRAKAQSGGPQACVATGQHQAETAALGLAGIQLLEGEPQAHPRSPASPRHTTPHHPLV